MYTIKSDKLQVVVKSFGAELNSIKKLARIMNIYGKAIQLIGRGKHQYYFQ